MNKIRLFALLIAFSVMAASVFAVAPSKEVIEQWKNDGVLLEKMEILKKFKQAGGCAPNESFFKNKTSLSLAADADTVVAKVIVILVQFSDNLAAAGPQSGTIADFDSILFSQGYVNPTGSMTDYYLENSFGAFKIEADIKGWYTLPQTYAYYCNDSSGMSVGIGQPSARDLAQDAVNAANADGVDFAIYDNNLDGQCDGVIIIHAGPGAETTGSSGDIWSHNWTIRSPGSYDGVTVSNYNINPEEYFGDLSPIGVFCHEYGHFLGLPDLYDTDYTPTSSDGLGNWSLMANGNYNGGSKRPAHFDPWCKSQLGFITLVEPPGNISQQEIPQIETSGIAYKLQSPSLLSTEYFIVENRQQVGFDQNLPGYGLLIYHVDENIGNNDDYLHYKVALEQADGLNQLANSVGNDGDAGDVYPNNITQNFEFHEYSSPNSLPYAGSISQVGVWDISASDSVMTADLDVTYSRPWIQAVTAEPFTLVDFDGDDIIEAGESVSMYFKINNVWLPTVNVTATLTSTNSEINFTQQTVNISTPLNSSLFENASNPITFTVPLTIHPSIDSFFITITTDSINGVPGNAPQFSRTFGFEAQIGEANVLIMDDDRGDTLQTLFTKSFYNKRVPSESWDVNSSGLPNLLDLSQYDMVFWHTGDSSSNVIDANKIALMKQIMDAGKSVFLSTNGGIDDIAGLDSAFLADYFKVSVDSEVFWPQYFGVSGNPVTEGFAFFSQITPYYYRLSTFTVMPNGMPAITANSQIVAVTYDGNDYKSMITSIAIERINDLNGNDKAELLSKAFDFFGGLSTSVYDENNPFSRLPQSFQLSQNYPNPFNPVTTINYTIHPSDQIGANTKLEIFNLLGRRVKTLVDKPQIPGDYTIQWDGKNEQNQPVSSGIYFYRLTRGTESASKKMTLLK